jgi:hypothetical protein
MFNFVDGDYNRVGEETQFSVKICTSTTPSSLNAPKINSYLTRSSYQFTFGPNNERLENLALDPLLPSGSTRKLGHKRVKRVCNESIKIGCISCFKVGQSYVTLTLH